MMQAIICLLVVASHWCSVSSVSFSDKEFPATYPKLLNNTWFNKKYVDSKNIERQAYWPEWSLKQKGILQAQGAQPINGVSPPLQYTENPNKFFCEDPYWIATLFDYDEKLGVYSYRVTSSRSEQLRGGITSQKLIVFENRKIELGDETKKKLLDGLHYRPYKTIPFPSFGNSGMINNWITFHTCDYGGFNNQILKIGTLATRDFYKGVKNELDLPDGVAKGYRYCNPSSIRIYVIPGMATEAYNEELQACLEWMYKPASEKPDLRNKPAHNACRTSKGNLGEFIRYADPTGTEYKQNPAPPRPW